jgi:hypothetical protein
LAGSFTLLRVLLLASRRSSLAAAASCLLACGAATLAPSPPAPPPSAAAPAEPSAGPPAALAPSAALSFAEAPPEQLRPYQGAFLADDVGAAFPERAVLERTSSLRLRRDAPEGTADRLEQLTFPRVVVVVEKEQDAVRFVLEYSAVRMLFWAALGAFRPVPLKPARLALRPGVYPQGPPGDPERDQVGVWVVPGWHDEPLYRQDPWIEVEVRDMELRARGWLDTSSFGVVFTPEPAPSVRDHVGVLQGAWLLESPRGARIARVTPPDGNPPGINRWFDDLGSPIRGFRRVRYGGYSTWIQGYVSEDLFRYAVPRTGYGRGQGHHVEAVRTAKRLPLTLRVVARADLFDAPRGDLCGRNRAPLLIPDRLPRRVEAGRREIEVPLYEVGYARVWVEEGKVSEAPPEASAFASPSASTPPR